MKAMLLAAGYGKRLRPLTDNIPKPLIPISGKPLILYSIDLLKAHGILDIIINTFHMAEKVEEFLGDGNKFGVNITFSREKELLGTGGGIKKCEDLLRSGPFVVINCDVISDANITALIAYHNKVGAKATMALRDDPYVKTFGAVRVDESGMVVDIAGQLKARPEKYRDLVFTGLHVMEPMVFEYLPEGASSSTTVLYPELIRKGHKVAAFEHKGMWADIGIPERLALFDK